MSRRNIEFLVRGEVGFKKSIFVRIICNSEGWLSFNISIGNRQRKGFGLRTNVVRDMCNPESRPSVQHLYHDSSVEGLLALKRLSCGYMHNSYDWPFFQIDSSMP